MFSTRNIRAPLDLAKSLLGVAGAAGAVGAVGAAEDVAEAVEAVEAAEAVEVAVVAEGAGVALAAEVADARSTLVQSSNYARVLRELRLYAYRRDRSQV
jgi:UDP-N-acetyl-D-mannosaminuronic acid transferase (WecB/TagA/CpsF family)